MTYNISLSLAIAIIIANITPTIIIDTNYTRVIRRWLNIVPCEDYSSLWNVKWLYKMIIKLLIVSSFYLLMRSEQVSSVVIWYDV